MYTVGKLARKYRLSRSTLLYYDRKGLLCPTGRSDANYRLYSKQDEKQLQLILSLRQGGVELAQIKSLLEGESTRTREILRKRLGQIDCEISALKTQQQVVIKLLGEHELREPSPKLDKASWVEILRRAGLDETAMRQWHIAFEASMPQAHEEFLRSLQIPEPEIEQIRAQSRGN